MSEHMAVLILAFSLLWCVVYTAQTVLYWPADVFFGLVAGGLSVRLSRYYYQSARRWSAS